jgi:hypothetical protein
MDVPMVAQKGCSRISKFEKRVFVTLELKNIKPSMGVDGWRIEEVLSRLLEQRFEVQKVKAGEALPQACYVCVGLTSLSDCGNVKLYIKQKLACRNSVQSISYST